MGPWGEMQSHSGRCGREKRWDLLTLQGGAQDDTNIHGNETIINHLETPGLEGDHQVDGPARSMTEGPVVSTISPGIGYWTLCGG